MPKVHRLKIEPMTEESFRPFGELMDAEERPPDQRQFSPIDFQADGITTVSVIWQPYQGLTFTQLERHFGVTQSFIQLAGSPAVVAAALPTDLNDPKAIPNPDQVRAFLIDKTKGFAFKKRHLALPQSVHPFPSWSNLRNPELEAEPDPDRRLREGFWTHLRGP